MLFMCASLASVHFNKGLLKLQIATVVQIVHEGN